MKWFVEIPILTMENIAKRLNKYMIDQYNTKTMEVDRRHEDGKFVGLVKQGLNATELEKW